MNIITTTTMRANLSDTLDSLKQENYLLVARNGKLNSALVNLDFFEDILALTNKKYLSSIRQSRQEFESGNTLSHDQVFGKL